VGDGVRLSELYADVLADVAPAESADLPLPRPGIALCLSGGGYRAMLFHLGALWRLNEVGYLPKLDVISTVSGGSITAAALAVAWRRLTFSTEGVASEFGQSVVTPLRRMASKTIDWQTTLLGLVSPGGPGPRLADAYDRHLLHRARLSDLPDERTPKTPRFVINAANLQSTANWRFSRSFMADYRVGYHPLPDLRLSQAVAASSAFPPLLSPFLLEVDPAKFDDQPAELTDSRFRSGVLLTDGGVYDNLGIEPVWKNYQTILVSDGGKKLKPQSRIFRPFQILRVLNLLDNQVRSRRKAQLVTSFKLRRQLAALGEQESVLFKLVTRNGAYWHMGDDLTQYRARDTLPCPPEQTTALAAISTRLARMDPATQERLINFGYAACDTHLRTWVDPSLSPPLGFPYPAVGVGETRADTETRRVVSR
jgi:NTE family protein